VTFNVVGLGEVLWDLFLAGPQLGGAPANFAYHARALCARAAIVTRVGNDDLGAEAIKRLTQMNLPRDTVQVDPTWPTGTAAVSLTEKGVTNYRFAEDAAWDRLEVTNAALQAIRGAHAVCFGTLGQRSETSCKAIQQLLAAAPAEALRIFDVNLRLNFYSREVIEESMRLANVLKLNDEELAVLTAMFSLQGDARQRIEWFVRTFGFKTVVLTRGSVGSLIQHEGRWSEVPPRPVRVADTIGAGDAFTAALAVGLLSGMDLDEVHVIAAGIAGYVCSQLGAMPPMPEIFRSKYAAGAREFIAGLDDVIVEPARRVRAPSFEWDHEIRVALPASYASDDRAYPVLWLMDGAAYFELAVKTVNYDLKAHLPDMIVASVGTPREELSQFARRRGYDFFPTPQWMFEGFGAQLFERPLLAVQSQLQAVGQPLLLGGGAAAFLSFLVDELRSELLRQYRMADDHTLFGDSGGGFFCSYALLSRPQAFKRYICGSPCLAAGDFELFRLEEAYAREHDDLKAIAFFGAGEREMLDGNDLVSAWGVVSSMARMVEILHARKYPSLELHARLFPGEDHASVPAWNLSAGLRAVWRHHDRRAP
jgi:fructokinase